VRACVSANSSLFILMIYMRSRSYKNALIDINLFWDVTTCNPVPVYHNTRRHIPEDCNVIYVRFEIPTAASVVGDKYNNDSEEFTASFFRIEKHA
jgi:hypothetical protein